MMMVIKLDCDYEYDFDEKGYATSRAVKRHHLAIGSGGGYYYDHGFQKQYRGGTGGGAVKIVCDKLIMYENSLICSNGFFDSTANELTAGGSGGSVWVTVKKDLVVKSKDGKSWEKRFSLEAQGGGSQCTKLVLKLKMGGTFGLGGDGRIRVDYHTPYDIKPDKFEPENQVYIAEGNNDEDETDVNVTKSGSRKKKEHDEKVMLKHEQFVLIQTVKTNLVVENNEHHDVEQHYNWFCDVEELEEVEETSSVDFFQKEVEKERKFDIFQERFDHDKNQSSVLFKNEEGWKIRTYDTTEGNMKFWEIQDESKENGAKLIPAEGRYKMNQLFEFVCCGFEKYRINCVHSG
eukprot:108288_1